ncbi:MAG: ABC transporter substrate-binding protein [Eubacteriales bacterium]|nr:ABC transporter substrate-binding protein [Clostridiales bacterium]MDY5837001.1 ABC transporter substrate-binding protein [Eubacteriales bacterium]
MKKTMRKTKKLLVLVIAFLMILAAIFPAPIAAEDVKDTLIVAMGGDPPTLDPHQSSNSTSVNNLQPVYETLYRYDKDGVLQPLLATDYERIDDTHWRFKLRDDVYFHNGEKMTANDVLFSFTRASGPDGAKVSYIMGYIDAENCKVEDPTTIVIATKEPFPLLGYLPYIGAVVVSEKEFTDDPDYAMSHPVGTGPFKFVKWDKNDKCVYERNDDYWGEKPAYKNLIIRTIIEANSRVIELEAGTVDIIFDVPPTDVERLSEAEDTDIVRSNSTIFEYLGMNCQKAPFDNPDFRMAIDYAIDQEALIASVYKGMAQFTPGPVTPNMKYFDDSDMTDRYDVEKAKELIKKSGFDTNQTLHIWTNENTRRVNLATILQGMLAEVGLNVEVSIYELATYQSILEKGEHDFYINGWGAVGFPEPDNNIFGPFVSDQIPVNNNMFIRDDHLDEMLYKQRAMEDGDEREALVKEIQQYLRENNFMITLANTDQVMGIRSNVKNFAPTPAASHFYHMVTFK